MPPIKWWLLGVHGSLGLAHEINTPSAGFIPRRDRKQLILDCFLACFCGNGKELLGGLEPWNFMTFPCTGNNNPIWRTHIFQRGRYTTNQMTFVDDQRLTPWFLLLRKHSEFEEHRLAASPGSAWAGCVIEVQPALNFEDSQGRADGWLGVPLLICNIKGKLQIEFHQSSWELPNQLSMATIAMLVYQRILFTFGQFTMFGVVFLRRSPNREDSPGECDVAQADWTGLAYPGDRSASERWRLFYERLNAECDEVTTDHQIVFLFYQWIKYTTGMYIRSVSKTLCPLIVKL